MYYFKDKFIINEFYYFWTIIIAMKNSYCSDFGKIVKNSNQKVF